METIKRKLRRDTVIFLYLFFVAAAVFCIIYFDGTFYEADSVTHYLYAKYAFDRPELFLNHWAKPVFVLLAAPFAQLGFVGMKIFNALLALLNLILIHGIARRLKFGNPHLAPFFLIFSTLYFVLVFSGMTEILFATFVSAGIFLVLKNKPAAAAILISFLPFVRSEGLFFVALFALYFILERKWKYILYLGVGHVVYGIVGIFAFGNFLWVFTEIPYASLDSPYGSGNLVHFAKQLQYVIGIPLYFLFWVGMIGYIVKFVKNSFHQEHRNVDVILVFMGFLTFITAHTLFWYFGLFNSMGLIRVLVGVAPLIVLICLEGFNLITEELLRDRRIARITVHYAFVLYIFVFPFTSNSAAIEWDKDMRLSVSQNLVEKEVVPFVESRYTVMPRLIYNDYYISEALVVEHFNPEKRVDLSKDHFHVIQSGDLIIWDSWHSVIDRGTVQSDLAADPRFTPIKEFVVWHKNREVKYALYEVK